MIKIRSILLSFVALLLFSSCATMYYQVASVKSTNPMLQTADDLVYNDDNCLIAYNFWSQGGSIAFTMTNKTDRDLFVHKDRCFLIVNGHAKDYNMTTGFIVSNGTNQMEQLVVIPPHSYKTIEGGFILDHAFTSCDLNPTPTGRREAKVEFTEETTPIRFTNVITYSLDGEVETPVRLYNSFYISSFSNHTPSQFAQVKREKNECPGSRRYSDVIYNPLMSTNRFWILYTTGFPTTTQLTRLNADPTVPNTQSTVKGRF